MAVRRSILTCGTETWRSSCARLPKLAPWAKEMPTFLTALERFIFPITVLTFPQTLILVVRDASRNETTEACAG